MHECHASSICAETTVNLTDYGAVAMIRCMNWDESRQLRHAAECSWQHLRNGQREDILELERRLRLLGYDGMVVGLSAEDIIDGWKKEGWIKFSPDGNELRLTQNGIEQLTQW